MSVEPTETVRITLSGATNGATLGAIKTVTVSIGEGAERFTGRYTLSFAGRIDNTPTTGILRLSIQSLAVTDEVEITVLEVCAGAPPCDPTGDTGGVSSTGAATVNVAVNRFAAACTFTGTFTGASTGPATGRGGFSCDGGGVTDSGTWTATRTSTTP
ncbi:MAG: hypothetical protein ACRDPR_14660 [Nocardioidaceae bacterium]